MNNLIKNTKIIISKKGGTFVLKSALVLMALAVLALCIFAFPGMGRGLSAEFPAAPYLEYFVLIPYLSAVPFFIALFQAYKLLIYIDRNLAFSESSVKALKNIKYSAIAMNVFWLMGMPFAFLVAEADDAPGLIIIAMIVACAPLVVAIFSAVLQKLVRNAIDLKSENDLTV